MAPGLEITPEEFPAAWYNAPRSASKMPSLEDMERNYIAEVLRQTRGKKVKAAKILGISRKTFWKNEKNTGSNEAEDRLGWKNEEPANGEAVRGLCCAD